MIPRTKPINFCEIYAPLSDLKRELTDDNTVIIPGKFRHIYQYDCRSLAVLVMPFPYRKNYWGIARTKLTKLGFLIVQDGDCEGAAVSDSDITEQAKAAIRAAGILRKRQLSRSQIDRQISWLRAAAGRAL